MLSSLSTAQRPLPRPALTPTHMVLAAVGEHALFLFAAAMVICYVEPHILSGYVHLSERYPAAPAAVVSAVQRHFLSAFLPIMSADGLISVGCWNRGGRRMLRAYSFIIRWSSIVGVAVLSLAIIAPLLAIQNRADRAPASGPAVNVAGPEFPAMPPGVK